MQIKLFISKDLRGNKSNIPYQSHEDSREQIRSILTKKHGNLQIEVTTREAEVNTHALYKDKQIELIHISKAPDKMNG